MRPHIETLDDRTGVEIRDPIERHRFVLYTDDVLPRRTDTEAFEFPVSVAQEIVTAEVGLPYTVTVAVRDASDGSHVLNVGYEESHELPRDDYLLEVNAPIKIYLRVQSAFSVDATTDRIEFDFHTPTKIEVGARSHHSSPAATITIPDDPRAAMAAVSTFGSTLKTTTCERSWPNLRGHPPDIERGDELSIPDALDVPEMGVTIYVPPEYEHVFAVAPLAYYFGATIVPGETPRVTADNGFTYRLDTERGVEDEAIRFLKRAFLLDCITRTEGIYEMDLHERRVVESNRAVDLDFDALYEAPIGEQLDAYCSVPYTSLQEAMPPWHRVVHVRPTADAVELLPYVVDDLSLIRVESPVADPSPTDTQPGQKQAALSSFKRASQSVDDHDDGVAGTDGNGIADVDEIGVPDADEYVPLPDSDATEQAWIGEGTPVHGARLLPAAFDHGQPEPTDGAIDVTVVCNDEGMREEWDAVSNVYGTGETEKVMPFDVDCRFDVPTDDLRDLLADDHDVLHFVGHIDGQGLVCPDGILDAETLDQTGATAILLNACRSHDQGVALVEAGARAAIVSWGDIDNRGAVEVGETFARLLNYGFNVGGALEVVEEYTTIGRHYLVVGDPGVTVAHCVDSNPLRYHIDWDAPEPPAPDDELDVTVGSSATDDAGIGSVSEPYLKGEDDANFYLIPGKLETFTKTGTELREVLGDHPALIDANGTLRWGDEWFGDSVE